MALTAVPSGHLAAIVTSLEMRTRPPLRPMPPSPFRLNRWEAPSTDKYRALFRRVGERWLWFSRLVMADADLHAIIGSERVHIHAVVDRRGVEVGLLELDFRAAGACEIGFMGLVPELTGQGHGRWLLAQALALGWAFGIERLWVHTCTLDHPAALGSYRKTGLRPFARHVEIFADPRLIGALPRGAAPQIPLLEHG